MRSIPSLSTVHHEERPLSLGPFGETSKIGVLAGYYTGEICRDILRGPVPVGMKKKKGDNIIDELMREFELYKSFYYYHRFYTQKKKTNNS